MCVIWQNFVKYCNFLIFEMTAVQHLGFSKIPNFSSHLGWVNMDHRTKFIKIGETTLELGYHISWFLLRDALECKARSCECMSSVRLSVGLSVTLVDYDLIG